MSARPVKALFTTTVALAALALGMGPAAAPTLAAEGPVWEVTSESFPTNFAPGGVGSYVLHVRNVGTATTDGSTVTVVDRLPPGVEATSADGEFIETEPTGEEYWRCTGTSVVTCTNNPVGLPVIAVAPESVAETQTAPNIVIHVGIDSHAAERAAENVVSVAGGGASEARNTTQTEIGSSSAKFGLASFEQLVLNRDGSPDTQAGSHPYEAIVNFVVDSHGQVGEARTLPEEIKDLEVSLPPGLVGNPSATPVCPKATFDAGRERVLLHPCPADTQVGTLLVSEGEGGTANFVTAFPVYNLEPPPGVVAQFAFALQSLLGFIDFGVRTGEGYAVKAVLRNLQQDRVLRSSLVLWGQPSDPSHDAEREASVAPSSVPLMTLPTSCGSPLSDLVSMDSWTQPALQPAPPFSYPFTATYPVTDNRGNPISIQGCSRLAFKPGIEVKPETSATSTPTGLEVKLTVPQNASPEGLATANLKDTTITLPAGLTVSPSVANGLQACTPEQIGLSNGHEPSCPDASKIGTVTVHSPLLPDPLTGSVYVAEQGNNPFHSLLAIYLTAEADGALVKLAGHVQANPATGQLTVSFDENPQLPFSDLTVNMAGGPRAALMTPATCGTYTTTARLTGWNGAEVTPTIAPFRTTTGCTQGFAPSFTAGTTANVAGSYAPFSTTISRADSDQPLGQISVTTPPGMLGMLSKVPLCTEAQASTETCPAASLIGHTTATAGPGPDPVTVTGGQVFLTGPYRGAPFGLSIVVPAVAGPFNLGNVRVRATIHVDPATGQITIVSDPLPTILQGIPLDVRTINVSIDRPGFTFNPTSCNPLSSTATIASSQGASTALSSRFQAADCSAMTFKPSFTASTHGNGSRGNGAAFTVRIASHQGPGANPSVLGEANIRKVEVQLPTVLPSRLSTLQRACTEKQFAANPAGCPRESAVGSAVAHTPVLPVPLEGPAYLVSHGGEAFPDLVIILQGDGVRIDLTGHTEITKGHTYSRFETAPDAPISSFELKLPEGPYSILGAFGNLCGRTTKTTVTRHVTRRVHGRTVHSTVRVKKTVPAPLQMPTTITAQNGAVLKQTTLIAATGCTARTAGRATAGRAGNANRARRGRR